MSRLGSALRAASFILVCVAVLTPAVHGWYGNPLGSFIRHYEGLSYDRDGLHQRHQRVRRATSHPDTELHLDFVAHGRQFNLRMKRDTSIFSDDFFVELPTGERHDDTSHIYAGKLHGESDSFCYGSVHSGRFEGFISTRHGTYHVEPSERYVARGSMPFHSVIYHQDDVEFPDKVGSHAGCANKSVFDQMQRYQRPKGWVAEEQARELTKSETEALKRRKRQVSPSKNTCLLYIQTDHMFFRKYGSVEAVTAEIANHVQAISQIYRVTNFDNIRNINFLVKRIRVNTTDHEKDSSNPFRFANIGVDKFLDMHSEGNYDDYCLSYLFTDRVFDNGVLGLAWVASPSSSGGICEKNKAYPDGRRKSLNTGIVTVQNYGRHVPPRVSYITFAHEIGHNFGSPHDSGQQCTPGEGTLISDKGNFIMYPSATSGFKANNNLFSPCSIGNISRVLVARKDSCFVESNKPICGNSLVEEGEACDCGFMDQCNGDPCCYPADDTSGKGCQLKPGKMCSPTRGPCCTHDCKFRLRSEECRAPTECAKEGVCNGTSAVCPASQPQPDLIFCSNETRVCKGGQCSGSICDPHSLEECSCSGESVEEQCHVCCMRKGDPSTCASTKADVWINFFHSKELKLQPGSPCNNFRGYCDVFLRCRLVDADGPLARLKKAIFNPELYKSLAQWVRDHWWAGVLLAVALIMLMGGFIYLCSKHTPSSNPNLPKHKELPGVSTLRRQQRQRQARSRRPDGQEMQNLRR